MLKSTDAISEKFRYKLYLPKKSTLYEPILGSYKSSKKLAKRAAALEAVKQLHQCGQLNDSLIPLNSIPKSDVGESSDFEGPKKRRYYPQNLSVELFCNTTSANSRQWLYGLSVKLESGNGNSGDSNIFLPENDSPALGILLSNPALSDVAHRRFRLYSPIGDLISHLQPAIEINVDALVMQQLHTFHRLIFEDVLKCVPNWNTYSDSSLEPLVVPIKGNRLNLCLLQDFAGKKSKGNLSKFKGCVVKPLHREMERQYVVEDMTNLSPRSKMEGEGNNTTYLEYYRNRYPDIEITDLDQPLIKVCSAEKHYEMRIPRQQITKAKKFIFLIPELVSVHSLGSAIWFQIKLLPLVLKRTSDVLKINTLRDQFIFNAGLTTLKKPVESILDCSLTRNVDFMAQICTQEEPNKGLYIDDLMRTLTTSSANEAYNLELEEFLGDSFLKFIVSLHVFSKGNSDQVDEGTLSYDRAKIISNKNLYEIGIKNSIPNYLESNSFDHGNWFLPRYVETTKQLESKLCRIDESVQSNLKKTLFPLKETLMFYSEKELLELNKRSPESVHDTQGYRPRMAKIITNKNISDSLEAIICLFLTNYGKSGAVAFMKGIGMDILSHPVIPTDTWYKRLKNDEAFLSKRREEILRTINIEKIEDALDYKFLEKSFLIRALTHSSYYIQNNITDSMELYEFLGDAIIDFLVSAYIFQEVEINEPGICTDLRSAIVNNHILARVAVNNELHTALQHSSPSLTTKIDEFCNFLTIENEENQTFLTEVDGIECPCEEQLEIPKPLGDLVEAIIGAIFLDSGGSLKTVWIVFQKLFRGQQLDALIKEKPRNLVRKLYEKFPNKVSFKKCANRRGKAVIKVVVQDKQYVGIADNLKAAKLAAARCALRHCN